MKVGQGKYHFQNGDIYTGPFENDTINGYGVMVKFNGDKYEGEWKDGQMHGQGVYERKGGSYIHRG
jgi:hypothetical protein